MWAFHRCLATSAQSLPKGTCAQVSHHNHKIRNKEVLNTAFLIFAIGMCFSYCCYRNWLSISRCLLLIMNKWKDQLKNVKQFYLGRILLLRNIYETSFCNGCKHCKFAPIPVGFPANIYMTNRSFQNLFSL